MKKDQNLPNKNIHSNNSSGKPLPNNSNHSRTNHPIILVIDVDHKKKEVHEISHKIDIVDQIVETIKLEITNHDQIQTEQNCLILVPIQVLGIDTIQTIDHETHHTIETETI